MKKQVLVAALAAGIVALSGCGSSASEQDSTMLTEDQMSPEQTEDMANAAQEPAVQPQSFTPREPSGELMAQAETFHSCSLAAAALAAVFFNSDKQQSETLMKDMTVLHNIGVGYAVLSGLDIETANEELKSKQYAETEMLSQLSDGTNVDENMQMLITSYQGCIRRMQNGQGDETLMYVVSNS